MAAMDFSLRGPKATAPKGPAESEARAPLALGRRNVAIFSNKDSIRAFLVRKVKPLTDAKDCAYVEDPPVEEIGKFQIVIFHAAPGVREQLTRIVRGLKAQRNPLLCGIGERSRYWQFPKGSYSKMLWFCLEGDRFDEAAADIPPEGRPTAEGPWLHNITDLPRIVAKKLEELQYG